MSEIALEYRVSRQLAQRSARYRPEGSWPGWLWLLVFWAPLVGVSAVFMLNPDWGLPAEAALTFLLGAGVVMVVSWMLEAARLNAVVDAAMALQKKEGPYRLMCGPEGWRLSFLDYEAVSGWSTVTAVRRIAGATVLETGGLPLSVPDEALPQGMSGEMFRRQLDSWRGKA